jgi:hypothetical protein
VPLPTEKTSPNLTLANSKILIYGAPGVGKTTLGVNLDPEHTLLLATEPGYGGLEAFVLPVRSWKEFRDIGADLANTKHQFKIVVVDTIDELARLGQDHVMSEAKILHPSDLEYGKGWQMVGDELKLRVARLCSLGLGVVFISHEKTEEIKQKVGTVSRSGPTLTGAVGRWMEGFVDYVLRAEIVTTPDGEERVLRTNPSENWMGKQRLPLPDPLPLDAGALREAMIASSPQPETEQPTDEDPEPTEPAEAPQPEAEPEQAGDEPQQLLAEAA